MITPMHRFAVIAFAGLFLSHHVFAQASAPKTAGPKIPDNIRYEANIAYDSADPQQVMDIIRPNDGATHPAVLFVHGGGFRGGSRKGYLQQCVRLAQQGYVTATADYRLAPKDPFPAAVYDVKAAVRYLRANAAKLSLDPQKICATGGSAGGHLVLFLGVTGNVPEFEGTGPNREQSSRVSCVVSMYGPSDLSKSYGRSVDAAEVLPLFLGGDVTHAREAHIRASPLNWVTPDAPPTLAIQGTKDRYVNYEQSVWIIDRLLSVGVEAELETIEGADHGFKGADAERAEKRMIGFFERHLK
jgi:acetyl esterase/lipase